MISQPAGWVSYVAWWVAYLAHCVRRGLAAAVAVALVSTGALIVAPAPAHAQKFEYLGCYFKKGDKTPLWLAAVALDPKFTDPATYDDPRFAVRIEVGDFKGEIKGDDILVNPMKMFNYKGAEQYQLMKFSLVVDYSASIPPEVRTDVLNFIDEFIVKMPLAIEGQLIRFSTTVDKRPFTTKIADIRAQLKEPIQYGQTALHDALMAAATDLTQQGSSTPVRLIVLFTDGYDTSSKTYQDRQSFISSFTTVVKNERIAVAAIGVTNQQDKDLLDSISDRNRGIAGLYIPVQDFKGLRRALSQVEAMVNNTVIFRLPKIGPDKGQAKIFMGEKTQGGNMNTWHTFECEY